MSNATHAPSTSATPRQLIEELDDHGKSVAFKAFFNITKAWGLESEDERRLLGSPVKPTFYKWKNENVGSVPSDTIRRISYILGIYKALHIIYGKQDLADSWVKKQNDVFNGQSALERMTAGDLVDLAYVREYLDVVRGGWQ